MGQYIERRPKIIHEKTLEVKVLNHRNDLTRKNLSSKKIKRNKRQPDDFVVISSERSCISTSSNVARALRMRIPKRNPKLDDAFFNRLDLTQILHFSKPIPLAAPPTKPIQAGPSAPQSTTPRQLTPVLQKEKRKITMSDTSDSDTSSIKRSKRLLKKQKKPTSSSSIVENRQHTEGYSAEIPISDSTFIGEVSPPNPNERWSKDPNPNLPREMTVLQSESN